jgi:hypothetical protein
LKEKQGEFLAKSMERRTRYHLVFEKTERNELRNLFSGTHGILLEEKQSSFAEATEEKDAV